MPAWLCVHSTMKRVLRQCQSFLASVDFICYWVPRFLEIAEELLKRVYQGAAAELMTEWFLINA